MAGFFSKLLSAGEGRQVKEFQAIATRIGTLEPSMQALSDDELRGLTPRFRERLDAGESLDDLLPEAFAAVREASVRTLGLRHFDVQLIGGMALNAGQIAEMKTGEGKTLVSTLAGYLNALPGKNVHIVTVNDYLARRDSEWMGRIYKFMGMRVGLIQNGMRPEKKKPAYEADVTYGTNSEFGFDYLRDNMVTRATSRVQRGHHFAVVDEVDSILIDEARTPLIISGAGQAAADTYNKFARAMVGLQEGVDFEKDEAKRTINATESGLEHIEDLLGIDDIYADPSGALANHLQQALKAQFLFHRDIDYVVVGGEVKIVDEFTGRIMEGRRWSEGLHQAVEAKEHVKVKEENQTLATITLQNYFRLYEKLSGMTGTAMTEDSEFREIYKLAVTAIPPNRPVVRLDNNDLIYQSIDAKFEAVADDVAARHAAGQPCLVGTVSIESSERLSRLLDKRGIKHETLNAKNHEREAHIVAQAGRVGAVTIATNMAGRGTDILLGGNPEGLADIMLMQRGFDPISDPVKRAQARAQLEQALTADDPRVRAKAKEALEKLDAAAPIPPDEERERANAEASEICAREHDQVVSAGGLCVIGTERHESRRIDNQLRGRSGRQGDPGASKFFLCLQDDLLRIFGADRIERFLKPLGGLEEDDVISSPWISKTLQKSQEKVEARNFDIRKNLLKYDNVMNDQRKVIYDQRRELMMADAISDTIQDMRDEIIEAMTETYTPDEAAVDEWNPDALQEDALRVLDLQLPVSSWVKEGIGTREITDRIKTAADEKMSAKRREFGDELMNMIEKNVTLQILDQVWKEHLQILEYMRHTIVLRAYGQKDPLNEYKREAFYLFSGMIGNMREQVTQFLAHVELAPETVQTIREVRRHQEMTARHDEFGDAFGNPPESQQENSLLDNSPFRYAKDGEIDPNDPSTWGKVSRNAPCPCGSGKKYKHCHGAIG